MAGRWCVRSLVLVLTLATMGPRLQAQDPPRPLRALLITGGCCHDYARQKDLLKRGIEARAFVQVTQIHTGDTSTKARFEMYNSPDWAQGYDVIIHDECTSDVTEIPYVDNILAPHRQGLPAVNLHCAMHCYRTGRDDWFQFVGIHSTGHGPQKPIDITFIDRDHPITRGLENWTTVNEELYNNIRLFDTTVPLARGRQDTGAKVDDFVVAWANTFGKGRVFSTTLGHNTETVGDPRYLDLVVRGLLWATDKQTPAYQKPFATPKKEKVPVNLARGKKASATASQDGHPPEHAVDGNPDTRWCSPNGSAGQTWTVDLGEPQPVTGCQILWEMDDTNYRYRVEGSADGQDWKLLSDQTKTEIRDQAQTLTFQAPGTRYVRITITGLDAGRWGSFFEFEVHGTQFEERVVNADESYRPRAVRGTGLLQGVKAPAGFNVSLFAAPPQVTYPVCLTSDPQGTVYVGIDTNGSLDKQPGRGRIVRCRDTNGDGQADDFVTFATVDSPRGLLAARSADGKGTDLYVLHPPHLSVFHDRDGNGESESSDILVKNIGFDLNFRGADHTTNGIQWGIDGWIYVAVGDYGFLEATGSDGRKLPYRGGGIVRVRPDGTELEVVSRGQRNIYDVAVSPTLDLFTRDNTNDGGGWNVRLSHVPHGAHMGYPSLFLNFGEEIVQPLADYGGGSPCGSLYVDEPTLPGELGQALYTCDWGRSIVYRHTLTPQGAGFVAGQEPFLELPRPTDMDIDARGTMYVASWKDGGFNFGNPNVGYVLQVKPPESAQIDLRIPADWTQANAAVLVRALGSPSHTVRLEAQREILRRGQPADFVAGLQQLATSSEPLTVRIAALFTLKQLQKSAADAFLIAQTATPLLREYALRALADRETELAETSAEPFVQGLRDGSPRVRLQAARGLGRFAQQAGPRARNLAPQLIPLVADEDPLISHLAIDALVKLQAGDALLAALPTAPFPQRAGIARALQALHDPAVVRGLISLLPKLIVNPGQGTSAGKETRETRQLVLRTLARLARDEGPYTGDWWGTRPDTSGPYYKPVTWSESAGIETTLAKELTGEDTAIVQWLLPQLKKHKLELPGMQERIVQLAQADAAFFPTAIGLIAPGAADLAPEALQLLEVAATRPTGEAALRVNALRALQRRVTQPGVLDAALRALAEIGPQESSAELRTVWDEFVREPALSKLVTPLTTAVTQGEPSVRELAGAALAFVAEAPQAPAEARAQALKVIDQAWTEPVQATSLLRGIGRARLEAQIFQILQQRKSEVAEVSEAAQYAVSRLELDQEPAVDPNKPLVSTLPFEQVVQQVAEVKGDPKYGQRLFTRQGCVACHAVSQNEPVKGPLLLDISQRYKRPELVESIVKPSAKIAQGFEGQFFVTGNGKIFDGFVVRESGDEIELRNITGVATVLRKEDIEERGKRDISIMPQGLVDKLNVEQLAALLAYLESLKK